MLIALEEHFLPAGLVDQVWTGDLPASIVSSPHLHQRLADVSELRLPAMDAAGIDMQILSPVAPAAQTGTARSAVALARQYNDAIAAVITEHPGRFQGLAALPTLDPQAASVEARRAILDLGMCGVIVQGHTQGRFLDAPEFEPVLAAVEELRVPMYLHPTFPPKQVADVYFSGLPDALAGALSTAAWGWHAETGLHVLRMAATGLFTRHPGLRLVVGHMGENLPFSLDRADTVLRRQVPESRSIADVVREHVYVTICGYTTPAPFHCALTVFGADHILFSVDYPWGDAGVHAQFLADAAISDADRRKIAHLNAQQLFRLHVPAAAD